jgi:hypothetical protein
VFDRNCVIGTDDVLLGVLPEGAARWRPRSEGNAATHQPWLCEMHETLIGDNQHPAFHEGVRLCVNAVHRKTECVNECVSKFLKLFLINSLETVNYVDEGDFYSAAATNAVCAQKL